jgi:molybdopterin-guanine dinucleotide biosynthesis protein A
MMTGTLLRRLANQLADREAEVCVAHDGERLHPVFLLVKRALSDSLESYLASGARKVDCWLARHRLAVADYSDHPESFANLNTPDDLAALEAQWAAKRGYEPAAYGDERRPTPGSHRAPGG